MGDDFQTVAQAAEELGQSAGQVRAAIHDGRLRAEKRGRRWMISREALADYRRYLGGQSESAWRKAGRKVRRDEQPVGWRSWKHGTYAVYAEDQTEPIRTPQRRPAITPNVDDRDQVLAAIFRANRSAKFSRDKASKHYDRGQHEFARSAREQKERLYRLKDRGVAYALRRGWLSAEGMHGTFCVYRGCGYCFHSLLRPAGSALPSLSDEPVFVEAKPHDRRITLRTKDAEAILSAVPDHRAELDRAETPRFERVRRWRDWDDDDWDEEEYEENSDEDYEDEEA